MMNRPDRFELEQRRQQLRETIDAPARQAREQARAEAELRQLDAEAAQRDAEDLEAAFADRVREYEAAFADHMKAVSAGYAYLDGLAEFHIRAHQQAVTAIIDRQVVPLPWFSLQEFTATGHRVQEIINRALGMVEDSLPDVIPLLNSPNYADHEKAKRLTIGRLLAAEGRFKYPWSFPLVVKNWIFQLPPEQRHVRAGVGLIEIGTLFEFFPMGWNPQTEADEAGRLYKRINS